MPHRSRMKQNHLTSLSSQNLKLLGRCQTNNGSVELFRGSLLLCLGLLTLKSSFIKAYSPEGRGLLFQVCNALLVILSVFFTENKSLSMNVIHSNHLRIQSHREWAVNSSCSDLLFVILLLIQLFRWCLITITVRPKTVHTPVSSRCWIRVCPVIGSQTQLFR